MAEDEQVHAGTRSSARLGANLRRLVERFPFEAYAILLVAVAMVVVGLVGASGETDNFWFELARAGLGVFAVAFLGGGAAAAFRAREIAREDEGRKIEQDRENALRKDTYRAEFVGELWDAYHEIKGVRRALRAAGFRETEKSTPGHNEALQEQMPRLDAAQLTLEKLFRTVYREREVFFPYDRRLLFLLRIAEDYAKNVLNDWEKPRSEYKHLLRFIRRSNDPGGIKYLSVAVERAADLVYALRSDSTTQYPAEPKVDCDLRSEKPLSDDDDWKEPDCNRRQAESRSSRTVPLGGSTGLPAPQ